MHIPAEFIPAAIPIFGNLLDKKSKLWRSLLEMGIVLRWTIAWLLFVLVERYTLTSRPVEVSGLAAAVLFPSLKRRPLHARDEPRNAVSQSEAGIGARSG